ncbi:S-adenosyl-L-methionine-dependent methyltransferase [Pluteus cervinus]|uniref:S-adenosyl-L-methionine-dependent methyltransferase n=1 Tax=Pluteus cervinus TaxID=181527 RepID=A0ACD3BFM5_9AGAR|nr:S-adenosyl-L-methionine-dependent methyltransferase [Pluteus cervinus]
MTLRALEFYSGIGGLHLALTRSTVDARVVQAFDWDQNACQIYDANTPSRLVKKVDIATLTAQCLSALRADLWLLSPACQPYTILNPNPLGAADPRAKSFLHLIQTVLPELHSTNSAPSFLLIENVAGFETSTTRQILKTTLQDLNYYIAELLLTPLQFGIPNSRLRYYLLARKSSFPSDHGGTEQEVRRQLPGYKHTLDTRGLELEAEQRKQSENEINEISQYLDPPELSSPSLRIPDKVLRKWGRLFDIVLPTSRRTCCFTRGYTQLVERAGSILQMNQDLDTTSTFDEFTALEAQDGPEAVRLLDKLQLRYFSPDELLRIFAFNELGQTPAFHWPENISSKTKYRLIGNSVNVKVVEMLVRYLFDVPYYAD